MTQVHARANVPLKQVNTECLALLLCPFDSGHKEACEQVIPQAAALLLTDVLQTNACAKHVFKSQSLPHDFVRRWLRPRVRSAIRSQFVSSCLEIGRAHV